MLNLFKTKPLLDDSSRQWIFDSFQWCLENFDGGFFNRDSQLILPTKQFFPARATSAHELAQSVFDKVKEYTGLSHWPFELVQPGQFQQRNYQIKNYPLIVRGTQPNSQPNDSQLKNILQNPGEQLAVSYDPVQMNQPQVMVANYVSTLADYLIGLSNQLPPGGAEHKPPATEMLAIFMGFGVMFANTAYAFRGGCSSCHNHAANRVAVLSEDEATYALALFCQLKGIDNKTVTPQLKSHLRSAYKQAAKEINRQPETLAQLQQLKHSQASNKPDDNLLASIG